MEIAVIGAGNVGTTLGTAWAAKGHRVCYGVRDTASPKLAGIDRARTPVLTVAEAAKAAGVVVLATTWAGTKDAVGACGNLAGKVVLDTTNPISAGFSGMDRPEGKSGGELVAGWAAGAKVVKVFNTTGFNNMSNPVYGDARSMMLYCGEDAAAKDVAKQLCADLGFDPVDAGPMENARYTEALAWVWIWLAIKGGQGRDMAFTMAKR
jgi:predicted dinucleotide-binding enzyme